MNKHLGPSRDLLQSFGFALHGVWLSLSGRNMRLHFLAAVAVCCGAFAIHASGLEWAALVLVIGLVWVAETVNTAFEALTDLSTAEWHPLAQKAKDLAAGAVLLASITSVAVAVAVLLPALLHPTQPLRTGWLVAAGVAVLAAGVLMVVDAVRGHRGPRRG